LRQAVLGATWYRKILMPGLGKPVEASGRNAVTRAPATCAPSSELLSCCSKVSVTVAMASALLICHAPLPKLLVQGYVVALYGTHVSGGEPPVRLSRLRSDHPNSALPDTASNCTSFSIEFGMMIKLPPLEATVPGAID
jgi:hypothetical protein